MFPLNTILCPTDFSEPSFKAIQVADELGSHFGSELILLHVVSPIPVIPTSANLDGLTTPQVLAEMLDASQDNLSDIVEKRLSGKTKVRTVVLQGYPADEIIRTAATEKADLITIATHGLTGWRRFLFGSVTEKVVRLSPVPVLTIRMPEESVI